jgi:hypothetical protein
MFDWIKKAFGPKQVAVDLHAAFVQDFVAECRRQSLQQKSYDPQAHAFVFARADGGDLTVHLDNIFREWSTRDRNGRTALTARFVQSIVDMRAGSEISAEKLPGELMPGIRSHAQISNVMINNWIAGAPADDRNATAFVPFAGDLVACVLRDQPNSMAQMTRANLAVAGLSIEQAVQHAMANFRGRVPPPVFQSLGDGVFGCNNLDDHQSALLLLAPGQDYPLPSIDGAPVAAVPSRNLFYLAGSANRAALSLCWTSPPRPRSRRISARHSCCAGTASAGSSIRWLMTMISPRASVRSRISKSLPIMTSRSSCSISITANRASISSSPMCCCSAARIHPKCSALRPCRPQRRGRSCRVPIG